LRAAIGAKSDDQSLVYVCDWLLAPARY